jgi:hypothetical protein
MNRKWWSIVVFVGAAGLLVSLNSCGRDQQLVSIQVQPSVENFGASTIPVSANAGSTVQLRALGTYIHPPVTKDITNQVTWASNDTQMMTVDATTGLLTATGLSCGGSLVSATMTTNTSAGGISSTGAVVTGFMTGNVICFTGTSSGGGTTGPSLTINFTGSGSGTVTSSPAGLSCASSSVSCTSSSFASGTTVTLTAVASGTFGGWGGCDTVDGTGLVCTVNNLTAARAVTASFN